MAAPTRNLFGTDNSGGNTTSWTIEMATMASGSAVNDYILVIMGTDGNPTSSTSSSGWTKIGQWTPSGNASTFHAFECRVAVAGTIADLVVALSASETGIAQIFRIRPGNSANSVRRCAGAGSSGTGANPDPPSVTTDNAGTADIYYIAGWGGDGNNVTQTGIPTNYGNSQSHSNGTATGSNVGSADRTINGQAANAVEDPGTFTRAALPWSSNTFGFFDLPTAITPTAATSATLAGQASLVAHAVITPNSAVTASLTSQPAVSTPASVTPAEAVSKTLAEGNASGPNIVTDPGMNNAGSWTIGAGWSVAGGVATATAASGIFEPAGPEYPLEDHSYSYSFELTRSAGSVQVFMGGVNIGTFSSSGTKTGSFTATASAGPLRFTPTGFSGTLDNLDVHETGLVSLTPHNLLISPADTISASLAGAPTLTAHAVLTPAGTVSASLTNQPSLTLSSGTLTPNGALSAALAGQPTLTAHAFLTPAVAVSASLTDQPALVAHAVLTPAATVSLSQVGSPTLIAHAVLTPASAVSLSQASVANLIAHAMISPADMTSLTQVSVPTVAVPVQVQPANAISASQISAGSLTILHTFNASFIKPVAQTWFNDAIQPVFHPRILP